MPRTGLAPEEIRERAIEIALELIRVSGPEKLRLTDVAKALGVSHTALYAHFPNKAGLMEAVIQQWLGVAEALLAAQLAEPGSGEARILGWFARLHRVKVDRAREEPSLYAAFNTAMVHESAVAQAHVALLRAQLEELLTEAGYRDPAAAASLLFEATATFHHPSLIGLYLEQDRAPVLAEVVAVMLAGLKAR